MPFPYRIEKRKARRAPGTQGKGRPSVWTKSWKRNLLLLRLCGLGLDEILKIFSVMSRGRIPVYPKRRAEQILLANLSPGYQQYCAPENAATRIRFLKGLKPRKVDSDRRRQKPSRTEQQFGLQGIHASTEASGNSSLNRPPNMRYNGRPPMGTPVLAENSAQSWSSSQTSKGPNDVTAIPRVDKIVKARNTTAPLNTGSSEKRSHSVLTGAMTKSSTVFTSSFRSSRSLKIRDVLHANGRPPSFVSLTMSFLKRLTFSTTASRCSSTYTTSASHEEAGNVEARPDGTSDGSTDYTSRNENLQQYIYLLRSKSNDQNKAIILTCCIKNRDCFHQIMKTLALLPWLDAHHRLKEILDTDRNGEFVRAVQSADILGNTGLHHAARFGVCVEVLLLLLDHVVDVNALNKNGQTFLHVLVTDTQRDLYYPKDLRCHCVPKIHLAGFICLIDRLEELKFHFDHLDYDGRSFVHCIWAQEYPSTDCGRLSFLQSFTTSGNWTQLLVDYSPLWAQRLWRLGVKRDRFGLSLRAAISPHDLSTHDIPRSNCSLILSQMVHSSTMWPKDYEGELPFSSAYINEYGAGGETTFLEFVTMAIQKLKYPHTGAFEFWVTVMCRSGAKLNMRARDGGTALHIVVRSNRADFLWIILRFEIDLDQRDDAGNTALQYAVKNFNWFRDASQKRSAAGIAADVAAAAALKCVVMLVHHGAKVDWVDRVQMGPKWLEESERRYLSRILEMPLDQLRAEVDSSDVIP